MLSGLHFFGEMGRGKDSKFLLHNYFKFGSPTNMWQRVTISQMTLVIMWRKRGQRNI